MSHVQIHRKDGGGYAVTIDGVDLSNSILHDGFSIEPADIRRADGSVLGWEVRLRLFADRLDADLPDSIVIAERDEVI